MIYLYTICICVKFAAANHVTCELELCSFSAAISSSVEGSSSLTAYSHSASRKGADPFVAGWDFVGLTQVLTLVAELYTLPRVPAPAALHCWP